MSNFQTANTTAHKETITQHGITSNGTTGYYQLKIRHGLSERTDVTGSISLGAGAGYFLDEWVFLGGGGIGGEYKYHWIDKQHFDLAVIAGVDVSAPLGVYTVAGLLMSSGPWYVRGNINGGIASVPLMLTGQAGYKTNWGAIEIGFNGAPSIGVAVDF